MLLLPGKGDPECAFVPGKWHMKRVDPMRFAHYTTKCLRNVLYECTEVLKTDVHRYCRALRM